MFLFTLFLISVVMHAVHTCIYRETCVKDHLLERHPASNDCFDLTQNCLTVFHIYLSLSIKTPYKTTFVREEGWSFTGFTVHCMLILNEWHPGKDIYNTLTIIR